MKSSNIGGQAVMEGIMMKHKDTYAVAVRKSDGEIVVDKKIYHSLAGDGSALTKIPFVRGVFNFADSLILGMRTLMFSASFFEDEEDAETEKDPAKKEKEDKLFLTGTMILSMILAVGLFMVLPYFLTTFLSKWVSSYAVVTLIEGFVRIAIFIIYIAAISRMEDIQRTFMYHGAEHKCINCIEHGLDLNVKNVKASSRQHKRCGTSFLFFVMLVSLCLLFIVRAKSHLMRVLIRVALLPVIAGISYEILRLAGNSDNPVINFLSKPGLFIQNMTTKEPDDSMIEVAIQAVEAVFDWKSYEEEVFGNIKE